MDRWRSRSAQWSGRRDLNPLFRRRTEFDLEKEHEQNAMERQCACVDAEHPDGASA